MAENKHYYSPSKENFTPIRLLFNDKKLLRKVLGERINSTKTFKLDDERNE